MYMLLLDATKALDRVQYWKLFDLLIKGDVCPLVVHLILNKYFISTAVVTWDSVKSDQFKLCNGAKQGGVISSL